MKCDLCFVPGELPDPYSRTLTVVVDVLRTCTSLTVALQSGAEMVIPAESIEAATGLIAMLDRDYAVLAGEKDGAKVEGFDFGNSPGDFRDPAIAGKTIVFTSTNGAGLLARDAGHHEQLLLSFINAAAVAANLAARREEQITIVCAGKRGRFSLEDAVCGGLLCHRLATLDPTTSFNDGAAAARVLYRQHERDLLAMLRGSAHGRFLMEMGLEADLLEASRLDTVNLVPVVRDGRITRT